MQRLKTWFEPGSSPPSCLLFPWHNNELEQVPAGVEDQLSTHGSANKVTEPGSHKRPPPEVTNSNNKKPNTTHNSLKIQSKSKVCFLVFHTQYCAVYLLKVDFNSISVDPASCPLWLVFNFPLQPILISWHNKTNRFFALFPFYLCKSLTLNTSCCNDNGIDGLMG